MDNAITISRLSRYGIPETRKTLWKKQVFETRVSQEEDIRVSLYLIYESSQKVLGFIKDPVTIQIVKYMEIKGLKAV